MGNDYISAILCIGFTVVATIALVYTIFRRDTTGTDEECSAALLDAEEAVPVVLSGGAGRSSRWVGAALFVCFTIITAAIVLTLVAASEAATGGAAKCPFF